MLKRVFILSGAALLAACSNLTEYERQVADWEPIYCYKSIGAVQCYKEPKHSDSRRLVNFYGPPPRSYDTPDEPELSDTRPPPMIDTWVKDPEPAPQAAVRTVASVTPATPSAAPAEEKELSFMDGLMRTLFGKPALANKPPVLPESAPASTTPPAQTGTL